MTDLREALQAAKEALGATEIVRRIRRTAEMSASIMRDRERTGDWEGAERVARQFDRLAEQAQSAFDQLTAALAQEAPDVETEELAKRLEIKAAMIQLGERIAWGSDSEIMRESATALRTLSAQSERVERLREALKPFAKAIDAATRDYSHEPDNLPIAFVADDMPDDDGVTLGDLRRARAAIEGEGK